MSARSCFRSARRLGLAVAVSGAACFLAPAASAAAAGECTPLSVSPVTGAVAGGTVPVSGSVSNCTASPQLITITASVVPDPVTNTACDPALYSLSGSQSLLLQRGETRTGSYTAPVPDCAGNYVLTVSTTAPGLPTVTQTVVVAAAPVI